MAWYEEYDKLIDMMEENVKSDWHDVLKMLKSELGMTATDIENVFKSMYPEPETMNHYFKKRKAYRTMQAAIENPEISIHELSAEYGYKDYTCFFKLIKKLCGKGPTDIIREGKYECPKLWYAKNTFESAMPELSINRVSRREETLDWVGNENELIDRINHYRDSISDLKKAMRNSKDSLKEKSLLEEIDILEKRIVDLEERLEVQLLEPTIIQNLTPGLYAEFARIEECRIVYGLDIRKIIELYNDSIIWNLPLDVLCDNYSELMLLGETDDEYDYDDEDPDMSYLEDEMSLEESWQYYNDDDAEDPYGRIEDDYEQ